VFGATFDEELGALRAELWLDEARLLDVSPKCLRLIRERRPMDVSTGLFGDPDGHTGTWNGEEYQSTLRNYRPDHLALLPGERGACSWDDGCGIRANEKGGDMQKQNPLLQTLEQGYRELADLIQQRLDSMDTDFKTHYLVDVYDDHIIFYVTSDEGTRHYRQEYAVADDGSVELTGDPVQVKMKVAYEPISNTSKEGKIMGNKKTGPCCPERVQALIENEATPYTEDDREELEALSEGMLEKLEAAAAQSVQNTDTPQDSGEQEITPEQAFATLKAYLDEDPDRAWDLLPQAVREQAQAGIQHMQEHKRRLIEGITANENSAFTAEELESLPVEVLEKIAKQMAIKPTANFVGAGSGSPSINKEDKGEAYIPPWVLKANQSDNKDKQE